MRTALQRSAIRMSKGSRVAIMIATMVAATGLTFALPATAANADPGHCWRQGAGPISEEPAGFLYQINNICSSSIKVEIVFSDGLVGECKAIGPNGYAWYNTYNPYTYWYAQNCLKVN